MGKFSGKAIFEEQEKHHFHLILQDKTIGKMSMSKKLI
jgi:hypothetical protein